MLKLILVATIFCFLIMICYFILLLTFKRYDFRRNRTLDYAKLYLKLTEVENKYLKFKKNNKLNNYHAIDRYLSDASQILNECEMDLENKFNAKAIKRSSFKDIVSNNSIIELINEMNQASKEIQATVFELSNIYSQILKYKRPIYYFIDKLKKNNYNANFGSFCPYFIIYIET